MRRTTEGATNLYRLTLQRSGSSACPETDGRDVSLDELLAPLGVEVVRCDRVSGPRCRGGSNPGTRIAVVDLRIPIDLPAIDYVLRSSGLAVTDLESVDSLDVTGDVGSVDNQRSLGGRRPAGV